MQSRKGRKVFAKEVKSSPVVTPSTPSPSSTMPMSMVSLCTYPDKEDA